MKYIELEKTAKKNYDGHKGTKKKHKDDSYVPEVLGLAAAGLIGANIYSKGFKKGLSPALDGALKGGIRNVKFKKANIPRALGSLKNMADTGRAKSQGYYDEFAKGVANLKAQKGIPQGSPYSAFKEPLKSGVSLRDKIRYHMETPSDIKNLARVSKDRVTLRKDFVDDVFHDWAKKEQVKGAYNSMDKGKQAQFKKHLKKVLAGDDVLVTPKQNYFKDTFDEARKFTPIKDYPKEKLVDAIPSNNQGKLDEKVLIKLLEKGNKNHSFRDGAVAGTGFAGASLAAHALGEKYFDNQDDDKVRKIVRNSYGSEIRPGYRHRKPLPHDRARRITGQEKVAMKIPKVKLKGMKLSDKAKDNLLIAAGAFADGAMIGTLPAAASIAIKRDIRGGFAPIGEPGENPGAIVIDIPMKDYNQMVKTAALDVRKTLSKIKDSERAMKFMGDRKKALIRVLPWSAGSSAVIAATGMDFNKKLDEMKVQTDPLRDGYARLTIQAPGSTATRQSDFMMMKSASVKKAIENVEKDIKAKTGGTEKDKEKALEKLYNQKLSEGITGKQYQFRMTK